MALTTKVLDLVQGTPAENVLVELYLRENRTLQRELIQASYTNEEGNLNSPLLTDEKVRKGDYEILFYIGDYYQQRDTPLKEPSFLDIIPVRFTIHDTAENFHVPLLVTPFGYQVFRG